MAESKAIELIRHIVAEETADLRERLQHLEAGNKPAAEPMVASMESPTHAEAAKAANDLQKRLDHIKAMHRLDATPVQHVRDNQNRMVEAPEGLWEISCVICKDTPQIWREGDPTPKHCKTWRIANGETV